MKKIILLTWICVFLLTGCSVSSSIDETGSTEMMNVNEENKGDKNSTIQAYGVVEATDSKTISVDFHARVDKIHVKSGQKVQRGDKLVDFDISALQNDINSKNMDLKQINFQLSQSDYSVGKVRLELESAKAELETLEKNMISNKKLYDVGAISQVDYDDFKNKLANQKRHVKSLQMSLKDSESAQVDGDMQKKNTKERLEEEIKLLNDKYEKANFVNGNQIICDINHGVVADVFVKEGAYVDRESNVMNIVNLDTRMVKADIAEEFISKVYVGQKAEITSMAVPNKVYKGKISRIWGMSIKKGGETIIPVEIEIENLDDDLYMNFSVDVSVQLDKEGKK